MCKVYIKQGNNIIIKESVTFNAIKPLDSIISGIKRVTLVKVGSKARTIPYSRVV